MARRGSGSGSSEALALGLLGDWCCERRRGGSTSSCGSELVGAAGAIRRGHLQITGEGRWLVPVAMLFALCVAWRDSAALAALNLLAFVVAASSPCCGPGPAGCGSPASRSTCWAASTPER